MKIKGSGNTYYEVDLDEVTCSCRDWTCRRHNFNKNDKRRLCKHLTEAIELCSLSDSSMLDIRMPNYVNVRNEDICHVSKKLEDSCMIIRHFVCRKIGSNIVTSTFIPIIVRFTYDNHINLMDEVLGNEYRFIKGDDYSRFYIGNIPLVIIKSSMDDFLFQSIYFELEKEDYIRLSSLCYRTLGLKLSRYGLVGDDNNIVNMNIYTIEDLCNILKVNDIFKLTS